MKNLKYFPFERNRYFYGKLLSVDDFDAEQRYMNDKRRLINYFLHGTGVVCGLQVVEVDDVTISLEMGLALDFSGREIVVPQPVTRKLSSIDGFRECEENGDGRHELYLGIVYDEKPKEAVHNIARVDSLQEEEFNKYAEGYRLFLTGEEPEREGNRQTQLYEQTKTVYQGNGIRIRQTVPRYIQSGMEAEFTVVLEKPDQTKPVSFTYEIPVMSQAKGNVDRLVVSFDEEAFAPSGRYVWRQTFRAGTVAAVGKRLELQAENLILRVGDETKRDKVYGSFPVYVTEEDIRRVMVREYYQTAMEDILQENYKQPVYLARLEVIRAGESYVIERVENLPCQQYVWNNRLTSALETMRLEEPSTAGRTAKRENSIRTGSAWIRFGFGGAPGQCFYTGEIEHGLGPGAVFLSLGIAQENTEHGVEVFGNPELFQDIKCPRVELAAKVDMGRGCFVIALKCLEPIPAGRLQIIWMAVKEGE